jgi:micrococcal nuclease
MMRLKPILALLVLAFLFPILALAAPDEASGIVTNVVDGDTFDLRIEKTDPRIIYEIERVRLADVDSPEMSTPEGPPAKAFTTETLLGQKVWLDIDNKPKDGRDMYDRLLAVVYLEDANATISNNTWISTNTTVVSKEVALDYYERLSAGKELDMVPEDLSGNINVTHPFNRLLVDAGFVVVKDFTNNEFDPATWWEEGIPQPDYMFEKASVKGVGYKNVETIIQTTTTSATDGQFVGSLESDKYHYPTCRWAEKILPENEIWFASSEEARAVGYVPCGVCHPP